MAPDIQQDARSPLNYTALATQTEGYSATDLQDFVARAVHQAAIRSVKNTDDAEVSRILFGFYARSGLTRAFLWTVDDSDGCGLRDCTN